MPAYMIVVYFGIIGKYLIKFKRVGKMRKLRVGSK